MKVLRAELDFIAAPRAPKAIGIAVLATALLLATCLVYRLHEVRSELVRLEMSQIYTADRQPTRVQTREQLDEETKSVETTLRQLALPWGMIIETAESAVTPDIAILRMEPDAQQRILRLGAEARTQEAMMEYLRQLASSKTLSEVHVASHQVQTDTSQRPIQFSIQARLKEKP